MASVTRGTLLSVFGSDFSEFIEAPSVGASGGILVTWRRHIGTSGARRVDSYSVSIQFSPDDGQPWWLTCAYGPQGNEDKIQSLQELCNIRNACQGPWVIVGDFNLIYKDEDKNNANYNRALMGRFRRFINDTLLLRNPNTWSQIYMVKPASFPYSGQVGSGPMFSRLGGEIP